MTTSSSCNGYGWCIFVKIHLTTLQQQFENLRPARTGCQRQGWQCNCKVHGTHASCIAILKEMGKSMVHKKSLLEIFWSDYIARFIQTKQPTNPKLGKRVLHTLADYNLKLLRMQIPHIYIFSYYIGYSLYLYIHIYIYTLLPPDFRTSSDCSHLLITFVDWFLQWHASRDPKMWSYPAPNQLPSTHHPDSM